LGERVPNVSLSLWRRGWSVSKVSLSLARERAG
jgi:hypothetical protein